MSLGSGRFYRRWALARTGLGPGMKLLDVATATGLVARSAIDVLREPRAVVGLDPSRGMLQKARRALTSPLVQGRAEALPFRSDRFDLLSVGHALRHVAELKVTFREFLRVLKPSGRLSMLEIAALAPDQPVAAAGISATDPAPDRADRHPERERRAAHDYYWETIAECVPAARILEILGRAAS